MQVISNRKEVQNISREWKRRGLMIGLVPTMGYLHEGHESLIKKAREENDKVIVSDFVNPLQFGPTEDLDTYPRDFDMDKKICESLGVDLIFYPSVEDMYDKDHSTGIHISGLTEGLCGANRPGHFDGVCAVVNKLFNISLCDRAYFGQKDAQQLAVVKRMVRDLDMPLDIIGCPIIREEDGLAKSSRNVKLSSEARAVAPGIQKALQYGKQLITNGETKVSIIESEIRSKIENIPGANIDYVDIVCWDSLEKQEDINGSVLIACAVKFDKVRLIDNIIIEG